ncbi:MAG: hypothetical protein ACLFPW_13140 [Spirochaetaceae bacterium]
MKNADKPRVAFSGENGTIFNLIAIARKALKAAGKHKEAEEIFGAVTKTISYDEALRILGTYVDYE